MSQPSIDQVWAELNRIMDPEIPVISLVELGIVREVGYEGERLVVTLTPTFAGCPALEVMKAAVLERLRELGQQSVLVRTVLSPPWTTDWIVPEARQKLKAFGLAPPALHGGDVEILFAEQAACPYCDSDDTQLKNSFGPTPCRAIYVCNSCRQPFEQFKPL
jgi:ring-1,2-phenylacetyl-CoA epoxidase subunit PaaD